MRLILNVLWAILGGFVLALEYVIAGALLCLTIIGIPFGMQCFKLAGVALFPFGKDITDPPAKATPVVLNVVWLIVAGFWIFLTHLTLAISSAVTIIGIPFAIQHVKFGIIALAPFGVRVTPARD